MESKLPLALFKQGVMKLESFMNDMNEIREDDKVDNDDKEKIIRLVEMAGTMEATLLNIVRKETDEEDFLNENIDMDEIDQYPDSNDELLDSEIE
jgi:hypothetical protein